MACLGLFRGMCKANHSALKIRTRPSDHPLTARTLSEWSMDTPALNMSDLTVLAIVLAISAAAVPVALAVAAKLRLDRWAPRLRRPGVLSAVAALTLGLMSLCVLLGI